MLLPLSRRKQLKLLSWPRGGPTRLAAAAALQRQGQHRGERAVGAAEAEEQRRGRAAASRPRHVARWRICLGAVGGGPAEARATVAQPRRGRAPRVGGRALGGGARRGSGGERRGAGLAARRRWVGAAPCASPRRGRGSRGRGCTYAACRVDSGSWAIACPRVLVGWAHGLLTAVTYLHGLLTYIGLIWYCSEISVYRGPVPKIPR